MKLDIRTFATTILYVLILVVFNNYFYLININMDRVNLLVILAFSACLISGAFRNIKASNSEYLIVICFLSVFIFESLISGLRYEQGLIESIFADKSIYSIIIFFFLAKLYTSEEKKITIINIFIFIGLIVALLLVLQVLVFYPLNIEILSNITYWKRMDGVRVINSSHYIEFSIILSLCQLIENNHKASKKITFFWRLIYLFTFIVGMVNLLFVSKTRMSIIIVLIIEAYLLINFRIGTNKKTIFNNKLIRTTLVLFAGAIVLSSYNFSLLFNDLNDNSISVSNRQLEYSMYLNQLFSNPFNLIFGLGMINEKNTYYLYNILGPMGVGGRTDVGIVGFFHEFGLIGLTIYIWIVIRGYKIIKNCRKANINCMEMTVLWLYYILGSTTLCMFNRGRIIALPIMLYLFYYYFNLCDKQVSK